MIWKIVCNCLKSYIYIKTTLNLFFKLKASYNCHRNILQELYIQGDISQNTIFNGGIWNNSDIPKEVLKMPFWILHIFQKQID